MTKNALKTGLLLAALIAAAPQAYAFELNRHAEESETPPAGFDKTIDDLPLMPGLKPVDEDKDVLFVVPNQGRIADARAEGEVDIDDVYHFYQKTLPQLGWKAVDARTYERESERLRIEARANEKIANVRFSISPK